MATQDKLVFWPVQIYSIYDDGWESRVAMTEQILLGRISKLADSNTPLNDWNRGLIHAYPRVAASLVSLAETQEDIRRAILDDPICTLYYLLADYDTLAGDVEELLLGNGMGQFVFEILAWATRNRRKLRKPITYYQGHLLRDPYWAIRANKFLNSDEFVNDMAKVSLLERDIAAPAAWFCLMTSPSDPVDEYQKLFDLNPFYTVLGMHSLFARGFTARGVDMSKMTPQWAYHLALFDSRVPEMAVEEVVLKSPEWTVEYIGGKNLLNTDLPRAMKIYYDSVDSVKGSLGRALDPQLHKWLIRVKRTHNIEN